MKHLEDYWIVDEDRELSDALISSIGSVVNLLVALLWSGRGSTGESLRDLKTDIEHIVI